MLTMAALTWVPVTGDTGRRLTALRLNPLAPATGNMVRWLCSKVLPAGASADGPAATQARQAAAVVAQRARVQHTPSPPFFSPHPAATAVAATVAPLAASLAASNQRTTDADTDTAQPMAGVLAVVASVSGAGDTARDCSATLATIAALRSVLCTEQEAEGEGGGGCTLFGGWGLRVVAAMSAWQLFQHRVGMQQQAWRQCVEQLQAAQVAHLVAAPTLATYGITAPRFHDHGGNTWHYPTSQPPPSLEEAWRRVAPQAAAAAHPSTLLPQGSVDVAVVSADLAQLAAAISNDVLSWWAALRPGGHFILFMYNGDNNSTAAVEADAAITADYTPAPCPATGFPAGSAPAVVASLGGSASWQCWRQGAIETTLVVATVLKTASS